MLKLDDPMKEESRKIKVITNGCVDAQGFFSFDVKECGINERCSFDEIKKILDTTSDVEEQKEMLRRNHDQLIGRTVTVADILASINYLNGLGHNIGTTDDIDHLATAASAAWASCCRTSSASASPAWSASSVSA